MIYIYRILISQRDNLSQVQAAIQRLPDSKHHKSISTFVQARLGGDLKALHTAIANTFAQ